LTIPALNQDGLLPEGLHDCATDEIESTFGSFSNTNRRPRLFRALRQYVDELRAANVGKYLVVNGSYVTSKPDPEDIDVLLVLRDDLDLRATVPPFEYNVRSRKYVKQAYGLDFYVGFEDDPSTANMLDVFRRVRGRPSLSKGALKIAL